MHIGLYASVFGIVITGLLIALGYATPVLSGIFLTAMIGAHEAVLTILPLLLLAHVAGALWHKFVFQDRTILSCQNYLSKLGNWTRDEIISKSNEFVSAK